jgi:hypothetical protein
MPSRSDPTALREVGKTGIRENHSAQIKMCNNVSVQPRRSAEFRRFDTAMRKIMTVSKEELQRRIEADPHKTGKRKQANPASASDHVSDDRG